MSFHTVRIVKNFPTKIRKKKSFKKKVLEKNITVSIVKNSKNIPEDKKENLDIKIPYNYSEYSSFNVIKKNLNSNHYIGLLIINSISINKLHNLKWGNLDSIYLNITRVLLCNNNEFPMLKIPLEDFQSGFKFKKFIKKTIISKWMINKKNIQGIKLLGNYGNTHIYTIIMNNNEFVKKKKFVKSMGKKYIWRNIFDQYKIQIDDLNTENISQENIYKKILKNRNTSLVKYNLNLQPYLNNLNEDYLTKYLLDYEYILHQLSSFSFE